MTNSISNAVTVAAADLDSAINGVFSINTRIDNNRKKLQQALIDFGDAHAWDAGKLAVAFSELPAMIKYNATKPLPLAADASDDEKQAYSDAMDSRKQLDNILRGQFRGMDKKLDGVVLRLSKGAIAVLPAPKPVIEAASDATDTSDTPEPAEVVDLPAIDALLDDSQIDADIQQALDGVQDAAAVEGAPDAMPEPQTADRIPPITSESEGAQWLAGLSFNALQSAAAAASEQRLAAGALGRIRIVQ